MLWLGVLRAAMSREPAPRSGSRIANTEAAMEAPVSAARVAEAVLEVGAAAGEAVSVATTLPALELCEAQGAMR